MQRIFALTFVEILFALNLSKITWTFGGNSAIPTVPTEDQACKEIKRLVNSYALDIEHSSRHTYEFHHIQSSRCPVTTTEQGKAKLYILDSKTTWRGNGMEATVCSSF